MRIYKFSNKKERIIIACVLVALFLSSFLGIYPAQYFYLELFVFVLLFLTVTIITIKNEKKFKITFKEIIIMHDLYKFWFFNTSKGPATFEKNEVNIHSKKEKIIFNQKDNGKLIGIAYKNSIQVDNKATEDKKAKKNKKWKELLEDTGRTSVIV